MPKQYIEPEQLSYRLRNIREAYPRLLQLEKTMPRFVAELKTVQKDGREFGEKHIRPVALELDRAMHEDPTRFPWDLVKKSCEKGFLSYIIPKAFAGKGFYTTHFAVLMEELCSHCPGVANIYGAHALGISPLLLAPDIRHYSRYMQTIALAEKRGDPQIFALAITEPGAGSDVEDKDELRTARLSTVARRVSGGYVLNGRKVFISNGSVARYVWVSAVLDRRRPVETSLSFVVPNDAKGFGVGRIEKKMGQRACPAAELIFDDVFIPEEDRVGEEGEGEALTSVVLGGSRGPVGAIATGIARGALERLLHYLNNARSNGRYIFEEQWCQAALTDLMSKLQAARALYLDATTCSDLLGVPALMAHPSMKMLDAMPEAVLESPQMKKIFTSKTMYRFVRDLAARTVRPRDVSLISAYSSVAKYMCSDLAMQIVSKSIDILGPDGPVEEFGLEKLYRDVKLTQIYEGTNQINRLNAYKNALRNS